MLYRVLAYRNEPRTGPMPVLKGTQFHHSIRESMVEGKVMLLRRDVDWVEVLNENGISVATMNGRERRKNPSSMSAAEMADSFGPALGDSVFLDDGTGHGGSKHRYVQEVIGKDSKTGHWIVRLNTATSSLALVVHGMLYAASRHANAPLRSSWNVREWMPIASARKRVREIRNNPQSERGHLLKAYRDGYRNGHADRYIGIRSEYAWNSANDSHHYSHWYGVGYQDGWNGSEKKYTLPSSAREYPDKRRNNPKRRKMSSRRRRK